MTTFSIRPVTEDQTDSPYVDVIYTLEEEGENLTDYREGGFGSVGTLAESSNSSDLASLLFYSNILSYYYAKVILASCITCNCSTTMER